LRLTAIRVALIAIFAAVQALLSIFPFTITIGVAGEITLGVIGGPLIGILLGPFYGGLSVLIGSFVGVFLNPGGAIFGPLTVIPPTTAAFTAGCVKIKRGYVAGAVILGFLMVFYTHPAGREAYIYTWMHVAAMALAFSPLAYWAGSTFGSAEGKKLTFGIAIAAFIGVMADHIAGSAIAVWYFSPSFSTHVLAQFFIGVLVVYPVERTVALVLTIIVAVPVYYSLRRAGLSELLK
jgi:hypothetical protein